MKVILSNYISRFIEELFPLFMYFRNKNKILLEINSNENLRSSKIFDEYDKLDETDLLKRLTEEHTRANLLDDKTSKLTLSISFGFTIIGVISSILTQNISIGLLQFIVIVLTTLTIIYSLFCSIVSIGALHTLPFYGYGTEFLIQSKLSKSYIVLALLCQEKMNIIRQMRNEVAFMFIRNSFICFIIIVIIYTTYFFYIHFQNIQIINGQRFHWAFSL